MKTILKGLIIVFLLVANFSFAQTKLKSFSISPERPVPGDVITIIYHPENTVLKDQDNITAVIYLYENYQWNTDDLNLKKTDSAWTATYRLPLNCAFIACKFKSGELEDTGGKIAYAWMLTGKTTGKLQAGAYLAWGMLRNATFENQVPKCATKEALIDDEVMLYWIKQELTFHPESRLKVFYPALTLLKKGGKEDAIAKIEKELKVILTFKDLDEPALINVQKGYKYLLGDQNVVILLNSLY